MQPVRNLMCRATGTVPGKVRGSSSASCFEAASAPRVSGRGEQLLLTCVSVGCGGSVLCAGGCAAFEEG